MKQQLSILFILFSFATFGQTKFKGTFCSPADFTGYCLTFQDDSLFVYQSWGCTGDEHGKGTYKIINDSLILNFLGTDTLKEQIKIKEKKSDKSDSITITFLVLDMESDQPIEDAEIHYYNLDNETFVYYTDAKGKVAIELKRPSKEIGIKVQNLFNNPVNFHLKPDSCEEITINMTSNFHKIIANGTKWEYKIIKSSANNLTLCRNNFDLEFTKKKK